MFDRLPKEDSRALKQYIGNFVSHVVVNNGKAAPEELNTLSREILAREWYHYETKHSVWKERRFTSLMDYYDTDEDFYEDVARYIDDRIPRAYLKHHGGDGGKAPDSQKVTVDENGNLPFGLVYHYPNKITDANYEEEITPRQLKYLEALAWKNNHYFYPEGMTKKEASECIDYFLNMDFKMEPECFKKHFKATM